MRDVTIVVLAKYQEVFKSFLDSVSKFVNNYPVVLVRDGKEDSSGRSRN